MTGKEKKGMRKHDRELTPTATGGAGGSGDSRRNKRRALLGAVSAAGLTGAAPLPRHWARPVVDHVLLPAHAQTSPEPGCTIACTLAVEFTASTSTIFIPSAAVTVFEVSLTQAITVACQRDPDGDIASSSSSSSESATTVDSAFLTTFSDFSSSGSSSFPGGPECELDLSDVIAEEVA